MSKKKWLSLLLTLSMVLSLLPTSALATEKTKPEAVTDLIAANLADHGSTGSDDADDDGSLYTEKAVSASTTEQVTLGEGGETTNAKKVTAVVTELQPHYGQGGTASFGPIYWIGVGVPDVLDGEEEESVKVVYNWFDKADNLTIPFDGDNPDGYQVNGTQVGGTDGTDTYTGGTFHTVYFGLGLDNLLKDSVGWIARTATKDGSEETTYYVVHFTGTTRYFPLTADTDSSAILTLPETSETGVEEISVDDDGTPGTATGVLQGTEVTVNVGSVTTGYTIGEIIAKGAKGSTVDVTYNSNDNTATFTMPEGPVTLSVSVALTAPELTVTPSSVTSEVQELSVQSNVDGTTFSYVLLEKGAAGAPANAAEILEHANVNSDLEISDKDSAETLNLSASMEAGKTYVLYYTGAYTEGTSNLNSLDTEMATLEIYVPKAKPTLDPVDAAAAKAALAPGKNEATFTVSADVAADFYYLVEKSSLNVVLSDAAALIDHGSVTKVGIGTVPQNILIEGLAANTEYTMWYTARQGDNDEAATMVSFTFDTTAAAAEPPALSAVSVTPSNTSAEVSITSNTAATLYYALITGEETAPTKASMVVSLGEEHPVSLVTGANTLTLTDLDPLTAYTLYYTARVGTTGALSDMAHEDFETKKLAAPTLTEATALEITRAGQDASFTLTSVDGATIYYLPLAEAEWESAPNDAKELIDNAAAQNVTLDGTTTATIELKGKDNGSKWKVYYTARIGKGTPVEIQTAEITILTAAPSLSCTSGPAATVSADAVGVTFTVDAGAAGTLYYMLITSGSAPTASDIISTGTKYAAALEANSNVIAITDGVTAETEYTIYYLLRENADGNPSTVLSGTFTTALSYNARLTAAKDAIEAGDFALEKTFGTPMDTENIKSAVNDKITTIINGLTANQKDDVNCTNTEVTPKTMPVDGSLTATSGTPGEFYFTVTLECGGETKTASVGSNASPITISVTEYEASTAPVSAVLSGANNKDLTVTLSAAAGAEDIIKVYADRNKLTEPLYNAAATAGTKTQSVNLGENTASGNVYVCMQQKGKQDSDLIASTGYVDPNSLDLSGEVANTAGSVTLTVKASTAPGGTTVADKITAATDAGDGTTVVLDATVTGGDPVTSAAVTLNGDVITQLDSAGDSEATAETPTVVEIKTNVVSVGLPTTAVSTVVDTNADVNADSALTLAVETKINTALDDMKNEITDETLKNAVVAAVSVDLKKEDHSSADVKELPDVITLSLDLKDSSYTAPVLAYKDGTDVKRVRSSEWDPYTKILTATTDHLTDFLILDAVDEADVPAPVTMSVTRPAANKLKLELDGYDANTGVYCTVARGEGATQATVSIGAKVGGAVNASDEMSINLGGDSGTVLLISGKGEPSLAGDGNLGITIWESKPIPDPT